MRCIERKLNAVRKFFERELKAIVYNITTSNNDNVESGLKVQCVNFFTVNFQPLTNNLNKRRESRKNTKQNVLDKTHLKLSWPANRRDSLQRVVP